MFQLLLLKNYKVHPISLAYYQILNTSSKRCTCVLNFYLLSWLHAKKHKVRKKHCKEEVICLQQWTFLITFGKKTWKENKSQRE